MKENGEEKPKKTFRESVSALESDLRRCEGDLESSISHNEEMIAELPNELKRQVDEFEGLVEQKLEQLEKILTLMDRSIQRIIKLKAEKSMEK